MSGRSFTTRLCLALALLLLAYGAFVALLGPQVAAEQEAESQQRLSHGDGCDGRACIAGDALMHHEIRFHPAHTTNSRAAMECPARHSARAI